MRSHIPRPTVLLITSLSLSLTACLFGAPEEPEAEPQPSDWCGDAVCEEEPKEVEQTTPPVKEQPPVETTNNDTTAPPVEDPPTMSEMIPMPAPFTESVRDIALHERYGCAIIGDSVTCWGDNSWGQARPPEDVWGDKLALGPDYACVVSGPSGLTCWGEGAWRVSEAEEEHIILGRHTITGASAASTGLFCYSTGYNSDFGQLACGDDQNHWLVGEENSFGVSVTYEHETRREPFICWIEHEGQSSESSTRYSYWCSIDGQTISVPAPPEPDIDFDRPQIMHDGIDTVTVVDAEGVPQWYKLEYTEPCRGAAPFPYFMRIEVDTSMYFLPERPGDTALLTPNCMRKSTQIICRGEEDQLEGLRPTIARQAAGYENTLEFQLCLVEVVAESKTGQTKEIQCERFDRR